MNDDVEPIEYIHQLKDHSGLWQIVIAGRKFNLEKEGWDKAHNLLLDVKCGIPNYKDKLAKLKYCLSEGNYISLFNTVSNYSYIHYIIKYHNKPETWELVKDILELSKGQPEICSLSRGGFFVGPKWVAEGQGDIMLKRLAADLNGTMRDSNKRAIVKLLIDHEESYAIPSTHLNNKYPNYAKEAYEKHVTSPRDAEVSNLIRQIKFFGDMEDTNPESVQQLIEEQYPVEQSLGAQSSVSQIDNAEDLLAMAIAAAMSLEDAQREESDQVIVNIASAAQEVREGSSLRADNPGDSTEERSEVEIIWQEDGRTFWYNELGVKEEVKEPFLGGNVNQREENQQEAKWEVLSDRGSDEWDVIPESERVHDLVSLESVEEIRDESTIIGADSHS